MMKQKREGEMSLNPRAAQAGSRRGGGDPGKGDPATLEGQARDARWRAAPGPGPAGLDTWPGDSRAAGLRLWASAQWAPLTSTAVQDARARGDAGRLPGGRSGRLGSEVAAPACGSGRRQEVVSPPSKAARRRGALAAALPRGARRALVRSPVCKLLFTSFLLFPPPPTTLKEKTPNTQNFPFHL